jgi:hypothetical protein
MARRWARGGCGRRRAVWGVWRAAAYDPPWENEMAPDGDFPIHFCSGGSDPVTSRAFVERQLARGVPVDLIGHGLRTPLIDACCGLDHVQVEVVRLLLSRGADVNAQDLYGESALMLAAKYGLPRVVRVLLDAGADLALRGGSEVRRTAAEWAEASGKWEIAWVLRGEAPWRRRRAAVVGVWLE